MEKEINTFTYYISTRFNVPTEVWNETRTGQKPLSEEWMSERFDIFLKYCLPSFENQKNKNFTWLVFFDTLTIEKYREIIQNIQHRCPFFEPVFVKDFPDMHATFIDRIRSASTPFVITSDIDNDDMLHEEYIERVQQLFRPEHDTVIDLKYGMQITETTEGKATANVFYMTANPFVSLVEETYRARSVMKEEHPKYRNYGQYQVYDEKPMFIQLIHRNNLVNDTKKEAKQIANIDFSEFGLSENNAFKISHTDVIIHNFLRNFSIVKRLISKK